MKNNKVILTALVLAAGVGSVFAMKNVRIPANVYLKTGPSSYQLTDCATSGSIICVDNVPANTYFTYNTTTHLYTAIPANNDTYREE